MSIFSDPVLNSIIHNLRIKQGCHTALLYGSRARGNATTSSDYDIVGIKKSGTFIRIAKKQDGIFWDLVIIPEKKLSLMDSELLDWKDAVILFERKNYGQKLVKRIHKLVTKPYKPISKNEMTVLRVWAQKQLERCKAKDIHGYLRRSEFLNALLEHYFLLRKKRYWGPKAAILWLKERDYQGYALLERSLKKPTNLSLLTSLAEHVYGKIPR